MFDDSMTIVRTILAFLGFIGLVGTVVGGIAYTLFQRFGEKWLDAKFERKLVDHRHEQQKELEQVRLKINTLFDRTIKLHQREFEVLPKVWAKLNHAYWEACALVAPTQRYPDLSRMAKEQFEEFVATCKLDKWGKEQLLGKSELHRNDFYIERVYWPRLHNVKDLAHDAHIYILENGIFLHSQIKEQFSALSDMVWEALVENESNRRDGSGMHQNRDKQDALMQKGEQLLRELESEVHERIWNSQEHSNQ
jgi:hypothetical protein